MEKIIDNMDDEDFEGIELFFQIYFNDFET